MVKHGRFQDAAISCEMFYQIFTNFVSMFLFVSTPHSYLAESIGMNVNMDMKWVNSFNPEVSVI